jgi:hypothetical protein
MDYVLIIILQVLGILFHVMQSVVSLGDKFPAETPRSIFGIFWKEDWDTIAVSFLVLLLNVVVHYILYDYLKLQFGNGEWYYKAGPFIIALVLGYAGQRLIYKWFGTAETFLDKQVTDKFK